MAAMIVNLSGRLQPHFIRLRARARFRRDMVLMEAVRVSGCGPIPGAGSASGFDHQSDEEQPYLVQGPT
jgi:hypothetical protein